MEVLARVDRSVTAVDGALLMRFILLLFWMGILCATSFTTHVVAEEEATEEFTVEEDVTEEVDTEEAAAEESSIVSSEPLLDRMSRFFNTPDDVEHAGLLGKNYFQILAQEQESDDWYLRTFDDKWHGYELFVNLAVTSPHTHFHLATDFFIGYSSASFNETIPEFTEYFPWAGHLHYAARELNARTDTFTAGATVYSDRGGRFRPFIQAGAQLINSEMASTGGEINGWQFNYYFDNSSNNLAHTYNKHEVRMLFNAGFEYDINSVLAYRMSLMTETKGRFGDSLLTQDLIVWPVNRFFLRFGAAIDLDAEQNIASVGGGFAF